VAEERERGDVSRELEELARLTFTPIEAEAFERRFRRIANLSFVAYFLLVVTHTFTVLGIPPVIVFEALRGVFVRLPAYIRAITPYIKIFYDCYILITFIIIFAIYGVRIPSERVEIKIPLPLYFVDFLIHLFCGTVALIYTGIWTYLAFMILAFIQLILRVVLIPHYEIKIRDLKEFARSEGLEA